MEFTFTLKFLQGSVVPIVTTQATALGTPLNAELATPPEVTQTVVQPPQQQQRGRGVGRGRRNWRSGYRGWRDVNREWQGDNRRW
ncbi:unnamed protein product [Macrosiphum euphorbiae]|uniref:Uncharacterized protein n=1 Tax=Macrosiphum euphorbiae TaxID=13131 RepID=A0AAV0YDY7_9HEMI|nr:unnamed protein product [Macrosiphum euphorbiae]